MQIKKIIVEMTEKEYSEWYNSSNEQELRKQLAEDPDIIVNADDVEIIVEGKFIP